VLPRSVEGSDSSAITSARGRGLPDSPSSELPCRSVSNHRVPFHVRFLRARLFSRSGLFPAAPFLFRAHQVSGLRHSSAGSPRNRAESSFLRTDRQDRLPLLSTPSRDDAVTVGFQPVERLVERLLTSFSDALSGARAPPSRRLARRLPAAGIGPAGCRRSDANALPHRQGAGSSDSTSSTIRAGLGDEASMSRRA